MSYPFASKNRGQIRQTVGYHLGAMFTGTVSSTGDTSSLIDTYGFAHGGTDDYKGRQVIILTATQATIVGNKSFVTAYDGTSDCTLAPVLDATTTLADTYEMWKVGYRIEEINDLINQAIVSATDDILTDKEDHALAKEINKYEYTIPTGFVALHTVEYVYDTKIDTQIHSCDSTASAWGQAIHVTQTHDTSVKKEGSASWKLTVAAGASTGLLAALTEASSVKDISNCDEAVVWIMSSVDLDAGDLQLLLDDTGASTSPVESLNIPACTAYVWKRCVISLANPESDTAIISVGIKMITDKGAFTLWVDDIRGQQSKSRIYRILNPNLWTIISGSTNYLKLTEGGYSTIDHNKLLRLTGDSIPAELSADSATCEIDPDYVVAKVLSTMTKAEDKDKWTGVAERRLSQSSTSFAFNTRWV